MPIVISSNTSTPLEPLVSCIVIFYNAKKMDFFEQAIQSILCQSYRSIEIILADDGSIDGSTEIAKGYVDRYPDKVRYIDHQNHRNLGMSATRNLAIGHATGEFVAFLDADDVWLPCKLEEQVAIIEEYPEVAMLYGRTEFWFSWMEDNPTVWKMHPDDDPGDFLTLTSEVFDGVLEPPSQLLLFLKNWHYYPCTCSVLLRRKVINELGGFEEKFRNAHEDMVMHSKIFINYPVYVSSHCWDRYRMHEDSYWRSEDKKGPSKNVRDAGRYKYLIWLEQYLTQKEIKDQQIWRELRRAIWPLRYSVLYRVFVRSRELWGWMKQKIARFM